MRKSLGILIALGLCLSFLPVHAEELRRDHIPDCGSSRPCG